MTAPNRQKRVHIRIKKCFNVDLFDDVRLARGLSLNELALEVEKSPQTIQRAFGLGRNPHPKTVKKLGEYLGIPSEKWYIRMEDTPDNALE